MPRLALPLWLVKPITQVERTAEETVTFRLHTIKQGKGSSGAGYLGPLVPNFPQRPDNCRQGTCKHLWDSKG